MLKMSPMDKNIFTKVNLETNSTAGRMKKKEEK